MTFKKAYKESMVQSGTDRNPDLFVTFLTCSQLIETCNFNNLFPTLTVVCFLQGAAYLVALNTTSVHIKCNQIQANIYQEKNEMTVTTMYSICNNLWCYCCAYYLPACGTCSKKLKTLSFSILALVGINTSPQGTDFSNGSRIFIYLFF